MMIGEISFCDQVGFNIKTDETKRFILDCIQAKYGLKIITRHFDKYEERMLDHLKKRPHLLCVRSNGNPYFLYLTKLNFVNYCIFIDKKIQQGYSYPRMIITHFKFDECLFRDTIFDGEMVKTNNGSWAYIINDLVVYKGSHLTDHNLVKRINLCYETLASYFTFDVNDICKFLVKKFFTYEEGQNILNEHVQQVDYSCRGIYIRPLFLKFKDILINFDDNLVKKVERQKYKYVKSFMLKEDGEKLHHTDSDNNSDSGSDNAPVSTPVLVDVTSSTSEFLSRKTNLPDVYELFDEKMKFVGIACVPTLSISKLMRQIFLKKNIVDIVRIKCEFCVKHGKWLPIAQCS